MASRTSAIKNNLNDRAHEVGIFDQDLELQDIRALNAFYDFTCLKCGDKPAISCDHVIPLSDSGQNKLSNLQNLCVKCNKQKGDTTIDYRKGVVCPDDYQAPQTNDKQTYVKHDWDLIEHEFVTGSDEITLRSLAAKHEIALSHIGLVSSREQWLKHRENFRNKLGTDALEQSIVEQMDVRLEITRTTLDFLKLWRRQANKIGNQDLIKLLELGAKASGLELDKRSITVKDWRDAGNEQVTDIQTYASEAAGEYFVDDAGERGAGWTD